MSAGDGQREEMLWQSYFQLGTQVLRNSLGITDRDELRAAEYEISARRQQQITDGEVSVARTFDDVHLAALHKHLFGDVYPWAGQPRVVDIAKGGRTFAAVPDGISAHLWEAKVASTRTDWEHAGAEEFAVGMGAVFAEANYAHPFREGNGRAMKLMLTQLAERSPWRLDFDRVSAEEWNQAAAASMREVAVTGSPDPTVVVTVFRGMTVPREPEAAQPDTAVQRSPALRWAQEQADRAANKPLAAPRSPQDGPAGPPVGGSPPERRAGYGRR